MASSPKVRVDSVAGGHLINRYIAYCYEEVYNTKGSLSENVPIKKRNYYKIQWENVKNDLKSLFTNPFKIAPQVAYSLLAFFYIFQGKQLDAYLIAFAGQVTFDAAAQTSHSGEPATISWGHTIGDGADRLLVVAVSGLSNLDDPQYDSTAMTDEISRSEPTHAHYLTAPSTGSANCTATGGNIKVGGSVSFANVDQTTPIGAVATPVTTSDPAMALTTTVNNSMRVDVLGANRDDSTSPTVSLDTGTQRVSRATPQNQFRIGLYAYTDLKATAGAATHTWTEDGHNRRALAFEILEASGAPATAVKDVLMGGIIPFAR